MKCVRCKHPIKESQAAVPIYSYEVGKPTRYHHYLTCCMECGGLPNSPGFGSQTPKHKSKCSLYTPPEWCRREITGFSVRLYCTREAGHQKRHRAKARFAGPTDITVTWPKEP